MMQVPADAVKSVSQQVNEATSSAVQSVQDASDSLLDGINQAVPGLQSSVESAASTVSSQVLSALAAVSSPRALNVLVQPTHVHSICCSLQAAHCHVQRQPHPKLCVDSTRGRGVTGWRCMQYSCFTGQCVQIGHANNSAQHSKHQWGEAWVVSFSTVTSALLAGPQAVPSDRCAWGLLSSTAAQGLPGLVITTVTGAMQCSSCMTPCHSQLGRHQQVFKPSGTLLHCVLRKSLAPCLP
jgi:hypothetical protein